VDQVEFVTSGEDCLCVQIITDVAKVVFLFSLFLSLKALVADGPTGSRVLINTVTGEPETNFVIPDSDGVAWCLVAGIGHLDVSVVDSDEVSSVQVKVLNAQYQVTVIYQVLRLFHIDVVLASSGLLVVSVVVMTEHSHALIVEVVTTEVGITQRALVLVDVLGQYSTEQYQAHGPEKRGSHPANKG